jgi:spermidine synthase/MFS family permease
MDEALAVAEARRSAGWRFAPQAIVFFSSACVMVLELVAGRLTARHLGSSLYTWTSIIGVVLAGISAGNYIGGKLADRWRPERMLGWLFFAASVACLGSLFLNNVVAGAAGEPDPAWRMAYPTRVLASALIVFLLPALLLGTVSPVTAKMAIARGKALGASVGSVYAWGAVGSIVGTFATGFWLIAALGARGVVIAVAGGLGLIGLVLGPGRILQGLWVAALVGVFWLSQTQSDNYFQAACGAGLQDGLATVGGDSGTTFRRYRFARDSQYQFIRVYDEGGALGLSGGREIALDTLRHGYVDLDNPRHLEFEYERIYGALTERFMRGRAEIRAFFLGGGGYTFPRWVQERFPGSRCDVAEIDPAVVEACHQAMGLPRDTTIRTVMNDARVVVDGMGPERRYDLIIGDAFSDLAVPWHLTTVEFQRKLRDHLADDGVVLTNIIEDFHEGGRFLGAYIATARKVFRHVFVFCTGRSGVGTGHDNFVIVAADRDEPGLYDYLRTLGPGHGTDFPGSLLTEEDLATLAARNGRRILTDDNAPVENLLAPIVR